MFKALKDTFNNIKQGIEESQRQRQAAAAEHQRKQAEYVQALQAGRLPTYRSGLLLNSGEVCYLESPTTYRRVMKNAVKDVSGTLTVTSTRVLFTTSSGQGNWTVNLDKVMGIQGHGSTFDLKGSTARGSGKLITQTPYAGLIVESAVKLYKRLLTMHSDETQTKSRRISQEVRVAVWQRDGGQCVQCGASDYLEFDHIIPFSRGGSNEEGNIQLLCRGCNAAKSNRI